MRSKCVICFASIFLCMVLVFCGTLILPLYQIQAHAFSTSAKSCAVMEVSSRRKLFAVNETQKLPMASTTKIMTAITAIENCKDLDEQFEVSLKSIGIPGTSLYLRQGDVYSTRDLLYALMLISGNDASVAIADHVAGSTSEFVTMMNDLARKIGAKNTHFANTHGLDADGHYTTAEDLALITSYALENETFAEIVATKNMKITNRDGTNRYLKNKNKLLFTLEGCIGVKTGYTDDAGRCLVSAIEKDGMKIVCVVLNCGPMFVESAELLKESENTYKLYNLTDMYDYKKQITVVNGRENCVEIGTKDSFVYPLTEKEVERLKFVYTYPDAIEAPMKEGAEIGEVKIYLDDDLLFCEKIYTVEDAKTKTMIQRLKEFFKNW